MRFATAVLTFVSAVVCVIACAVIGLVMIGCAPSEPKRTHVCDCEYLTDMDVPGTVKVVVCAPTQTRARGLAADCGTALGVGQVIECRCVAGAEACAGDVCEQAAARE